MTNMVVESQFLYKGMKCVVVLHSIGHRCGYVRIPKGHKLYGKKADDCFGVVCHGGITFSEKDAWFSEDKKSMVDWI